jgi:hypothetical protein
MLASGTAIISADPFESSPLLNELSPYDAIFIEKVSKLMSKKITFKIIKTDHPEFHSFDNALMKIGGIDDAARVHIDNISEKAVDLGYEISFTALRGTAG